MLAVGISHELRGCRLAFPSHINSLAFHLFLCLSARLSIAEGVLLFLYLI